MRNPYPTLFLSGFLSLFFLAGCGGGGTDSTGSFAAGCRGQGSLCIASCNLGCSATIGCSVTDIAVNQPISFSFSQEIDPSSVNSTSFSIRSAFGGIPDGSYLVQGNKVSFVPNTEVRGGQTVFGFKKNQVYEVSIPAGRGGIRAKSGSFLTRSFECSVRASRGVIDLDRKRPESRLLVPTTTTNVKIDTLIVVEFSEVINTVSFQNGGAGNSMFFKIRLPDENGKCTNRELPLPGTISVSVDQVNNRSQVVFRPSFLLPGNSCITVEVTDQVLDLSGKSAIPARYEFKTEPRKAFQQFVEEDFSSTTKLDPVHSGGGWGKGKALPGKLGGSGVLGDFSANLGKEIGKDPQGRRIYLWDTTSFTVPANNTLDGKAHTITNGVFEFSSFILKDTEVIRLVGSNIPRFLVSGRVQIDGIIEIPVPAFRLPSIGTKGLPGGKGAVGGAAGGQGGDATTAGGGKLNGRDGGVVSLPPGHPRAAKAAGTGGGGAVANPPDGKSITYVKSVTFSRQIAAGGGGGSLWSPDGKSLLGLPGKALKTRTKPQWGTYQKNEFGPDSKAGLAFPVLPVVAGKKSTELFLIGGSGGGGGGAEAIYSVSSGNAMSPGGGGAGGGGVLNIQSGGDMILSSKAMILAKGGSSYNTNGNFSAGKTPAPGGGGSGGSVLLQCGGIPTLTGKVDVSGGKGGVMTESVAFLDVKVQGGNGGAGYIRVEADPAPSHTAFSSFVPAATPGNVGKLRSEDYSSLSSVWSTWYGTQTLFPPTYLYYVIRAKVDGVPVTFSDNPTKFPGARLAKTGEPVVFFIQSTNVDLKTLQPIGKLTPWIEGTVKPLSQFGEKTGNGFRFILRFDRSKTASGKGTIEIDSVKVFYQG